MAACNFWAPNGEPSLLYQHLETAYGPAKALRVWMWTKSSQFAELHEDAALDANGEPTAEYIKAVLTKQDTANVPRSLEQQIVDGFLKDFGIDVVEYHSIREALGIDAVAMMDVVNKTLSYEKGESILPEVGYLAYKMLGKNGSKITGQLKYLVHKWEGYRESFEKHSKGLKNKEGFMKDKQAWKNIVRDKVIADFLADMMQKHYTNPAEFQKELDTRYTAEDRSVWKKFMEAIERFLLSIGLASDDKKREKLNSLAYSVVDEVLNRNYQYFAYEKKNDQVLRTFDETIASDPKAKEIVDNATRHGLILTGSLALRAQGTVYRSTDETLHDIDFVVPVENTDDGIVKQLLMIAEGGGNQNQTNAMSTKLVEQSNWYQELKSIYPELTPTGGFYGRSKDSFTFQAAIGGSFYDEDGTHEEESPIYKKDPETGAPVKHMRKVTKKHQKGDYIKGTGYALDFFVRLTPNADHHFGTLKEGSEIMKAKLIMGRDKDFIDWKHYAPYGGVELDPKSTAWTHIRYGAPATTVTSESLEMEPNPMEAALAYNPELAPNAANDQPSLLYRTLEEQIGHERALKATQWVRSEDFAQKHLTTKGSTRTYNQLVESTKQRYGATWLEHLRSGLQSVFNIPTDINGEPTAEWLLAQTKIKVTPPVRFSSKTAQYVWLSNFDPSPVTLDGETYPSVEHAFQAAKTTDLARRAKIKAAPTAEEARKLGRDKRYTSLRPDWESIKDDVMRDLLKQKFAPNTALGTRLAATGTARLIHDAPWDEYWGTGTQGAGRNRMGEILEEIRKPAYAAPKTVLDVTNIFGTAKTREQRGSYEQVLRQIGQLYTLAGKNPGRTYSITGILPTPTDKVGPTGFTSGELANLFASLPIPPNVVFAEEFRALIENTAAFLNAQIDFMEVPLLTYDEQVVGQAIDRLKVEIRDEAGNGTGQYFTSAQTVDTIDTIKSLLWGIYRRSNQLPKVGDIAKYGPIYTQVLRTRQRLIDRDDMTSRYTNPEGGEELRLATIDNLTNVLNSWDAFEDRVISALEGIGLVLKAKRPTTEAGVDSDDRAKNLENYYDSSFELNPKDTASGRIKLFLASVAEAEVGLEREPKHKQLRFSDPYIRQRILRRGGVDDRGRKFRTFRTAAQIAALRMEKGQDYITTIHDDETDTLTKFRISIERVITAADLAATTPDGVAQYERWMDEAFEEGFNNLNVGDAIVSIIPWQPKTDKVQEKPNFLGFPQLTDFESLFQDLLEITAGLPNDFETMRSAILEEAKNFRPTLHMAIQKLDSAPDEVKKEFVKVMSKQYQEFSILLMSKVRGGTMKMTSINANRGSAINSIITQWRENQKNAPVIKTNEAGHKVINAQVVEPLLIKGREIADRIRRGDHPSLNDPNNIFIEETLKPFAKELLAINGVILPDAALDYIFEKMPELTKGTKLSGTAYSAFSMTANGDATGIFSAILNKLAGIGEQTIDQQQYLLNNNPLYSENTAMRILAKVAYKYSPRTASGSHRSSENKTIYSFGHKTHLSNTMWLLQDEGPAGQKFRTDLRGVPVQDENGRWTGEYTGGTLSGRRNWLLNLMDAGGLRKEIGLQYVDGLRDTSKKGSGIVRTAMSSREQLAFAMGQFQNGGWNTGNFLSLTHSDKTTTPVYTDVPKFFTTYKGITKKQGDAIYNTFLGEYERIVEWSQNKATKNDSFNKGGGFYYMIPHLNYDALKEAGYSENKIKLLWAEKGVPASTLSTEEAKEFVLQVFQERWLNPEIASLVNRMKDEEFDKLGLVDDGYLTQKVMFEGSGVGIEDASRRMKNKETGEYTGDVIGKRKFRSTETGNELEDDVAWERIMQYAAKDFILNYFLFHTAMTSIAFGDPALTFKPGPNDTFDFEKVESTMKEYQKRLAKDIAPGADPTWDSPNETYRSLTIRDDERFQAYLGTMYKKPTNASDAQELTTVREHLYVMKANGLISDKIYGEMIDIINDGVRNHPQKWYEFTKPEHLAVVMQIMKPVSVSHNFDELPGIASTLQYIKSSSMPLYPPMLAEFQLDDFRQAIEGDYDSNGVLQRHIPRVNFISAKKVGAPKGKGVAIFNDQGDVVFDKNSQDWLTAQQDVSRAGLRIQQEVPYDELKEHILTGSQDNKLITQGIQSIENFWVRGALQPMDGVALKQEKERVRKALIQRQLNDFKQRLGVDENGVANPARLLEMMKEEALSRNYPPNDIIMLERTIQKMTADGRTIEDLAIPLFFNPSATKFESLLMSLIKKVGTVYMPGKSFIQASSAGFKFKRKIDGIENLTDAERSSIVWVTNPDGSMIYDGGDLKTMTKADGTVKAAQVLMPFNFQHNGQTVDVSEVTKIVDGRRVIDFEKVPKELLEAIGFRIPTQGHNSMLAIEVVGFTPANMGDVIVVPAAITMQMGSDFDVDKLYVYRRAYKSTTKRMPGASKAEYEDMMREAESRVQRTENMTAELASQFINDRFREVYAERYAAGDTFFDDYSFEAYAPSQNVADPARIFHAARHRFMMDEFGPDAMQNVNHDDPASLSDFQTDVEASMDEGEKASFRARMDVFINRYTNTAQLEDLPSEEDLLTRYFDLQWAVLTHPDMYEKIMSPLDKPDLKAEATRAQNFAKGQVAPYFSIKRQLDDFLSQKDAKVMVGISSNFVVWASIIEDKNLRVMKQVHSDDGNAHRWEPDGIKFNVEGTSRPVHAYVLSGKGAGFYPMATDKDGEVVPVDIEREENEDTGEETFVLRSVETGEVISTDIADLVRENRTKIDDNVSLQSEFLDHAKNRTIDKLNINLHTIHAALALVNLGGAGGAKPTTKHLSLFLRQPAILDAVSKMGLSQDSLSTAYTPDVFNNTVDDAIRKIMMYANRLGARIDASTYNDPEAAEAWLEDYAVLDVLAMRDSLKPDASSREWWLGQAGMLVIFKKLNKIGSEMAMLQSVFNQDPKGPGKNMIEALDTIAKRANVERSFIRGAEDLFDTEQGFVHTVELNAAASTYKEILPYTGIRSITQSIMHVTGKTSMRVEDQQEIIESFRSYIFSDPELGVLNHAYADRFRLLHGLVGQNGVIIEKPLATRVWEAQQTWGANNYFIKRLDPQQSESATNSKFASAIGKPNYVFFQPARASILDDQENSAAFLELLTSRDEQQRRLAEDLVRYAYVTGGISGGFSFLRYIPADYLIALPFASKLRGISHDLVMGNVMDMIGDFIPQWAQHNPDKMPKIQMEDLGGSDEQAIPERFELPMPQRDNSTEGLNKVVRKVGEGYDWPDYLSMFDKESRSWRLFKRIGSSEYKRIDVLGDSYINEYGRGQRVMRSVISENRAIIRPEDFVPEFIKIDGIRDEKFTQPARQRYFFKNHSEVGNGEVIMRRVAKDKSVAQHQRILAQTLSEVMGALRDVNEIDIRLDGRIKPAGQSEGGVVKINDNHELTQTPTGFARVLNHEVFHSLTTPFTRRNADMRERFANATLAFEDVEASYAEAKAAVIAEIEKNGFTEEQMIRALQTKQATAKAMPFIELYYSVSTIDEFMAGLISKPELQKILNETQSSLENTTLLQRLLSAFANFLNALMRDLGIKLEQGSILEKSLRNVYAFMEAVQSDQVGLITPDDITLMYSPTGFVNNQAEAERLKTKIEREFPQAKVTITPTEDGYTLSTKHVTLGFDDGGLSLDDYVDELPWEEVNFDDFNQMVGATPETALDGEVPTSPAIERLYNKAQEKIAEIEASIAKAKMTPELLTQRRMLKAMKQLAQELKASNDLGKIPKLAEHNLSWADDVAFRYNEGLPVSISEVMTAYRLIGLWTDILRMVYDNTDVTVGDTELGAIEQQAVELETVFSSKILPATMKKMSQQKLTDADFNIGTSAPVMTDINTAEAFGLSIERHKSKVVQEVALTIQNTNRNYLEDGDRLVKKVARFEEKARALAAKRGIAAEAIYEKMFQKEGHWGLVNRYSSAFYRWKTGLKSQLEKGVEKAMTTIAEGPVRDKAIANAYAKYWGALKKKGDYVDVRIFYNEDGTMKPMTDPALVEYYNMMVAEYEVELTQQLLKEAGAKFQRYLNDKKIMMDMLDAQVANGFMKAEDAQAEKDAWNLENSPFHKMNTKEAIGTDKPISISEKYLLLVPHKRAADISGKSFWDADFDGIQKDDELKEIYNEVKEFMEEFTGNLPHYLDSRLGANFLPAIKKRLVTDIANTGQYVKNLPAKLLDQLTATEYEEYMQGRTVNRIPIMHTKDPLSDVPRPVTVGMNPDEKAAAWAEYEAAKKAKLEGYTKDLPRILELFGLMSLHYKHFSEAKDAIDMGTEVIKKVDRDMRSGLVQVEQNGQKVTYQGNMENTLNTLQYTIDSLMFKRTKNLEGKVTDLYFKKDKNSTVRPIREIKKDIEDLRAQKKDHRISDEDYDKRMVVLNHEIESYDIKKLYTSKTGDFLMTWTQLKALSYNPVSAFANLSFGLISAAIHANGSEDYDWKNFRQAISIMMNSTAKSVRLTKITGEDSAMHKTATKILALMDRMGIMGDLVDSDYGDSNLGGRKSALREALDPYALMRNGDYFIKGVNMVAVMLNQETTVNGKKMSVWEAFDENGNFKGTDKEWQSDDVREQTKFRKLQNKVAGVVKINMGNQDKSSPLLGKKTILGRLVSQFRLSWFAEGLATRFETEREDIQLGRTRKGRYRTYADLGFIQSLSILTMHTLNLLPGVKLDYTGAYSLKNGKPMSNADKANMRKNFAEIGGAMLLLGTVNMLGYLASEMGDDEEGKKKAYKFAMNLAIRNYQDVMLYSSPSVFNQITGSVVPAMSTVNDATNALKATLKVLTDDEYEYERWVLKMTKAGFIPQTTLYNRYKTLTEKDISELAR